MLRFPVVFRFLALAHLIVCAILFTGCSGTQRGGEDAPDSLRVYYVMRHLHTPQGAHATGDPDPELTEEGRRHAEVLAEWFETEGETPPQAIYVSSTRRAQQTAGPLAAKLRVVPIIYDPRDTPALIAMVQEESRIVLIVGHSNTVPEIIELLGGARPNAIAPDQFGDIWRLSGNPVVTTHRHLNDP